MHVTLDIEIPKRFQGIGVQVLQKMIQNYFFEKELEEDITYTKEEIKNGQTVNL